MVGDDGQVLVVTAVGDLVDTEMEQVVEALIVQVIGDDAGDDVVDRSPRAPQQRGHGGLVGPLGQPRDDVFEVTGVACSRAGPRDRGCTRDCVSGGSTTRAAWPGRAGC